MTNEKLVGICMLNVKGIILKKLNILFIVHICLGKYSFSQNSFWIHLYISLFIIHMRLAKAWIAINRLSVVWKSNLTAKIKRCFFQAAVMSILLYGCTSWMLTKCMEKKLDGNYTRMLRAELNQSWRQHPTKTIQVRQTRHTGHCWRSKDKLVSDMFQWTPSHGRAKAGQPARTYIQQLCADTWCSLEDLLGTMDNRNGWRGRVREIRAGCTTWWWYI